MGCAYSENTKESKSVKLCEKEIHTQVHNYTQYSWKFGTQNSLYFDSVLHKSSKLQRSFCANRLVDEAALRISCRADEAGNNVDDADVDGEPVDCCLDWLTHFPTYK